MIAPLEGRDRLGEHQVHDLQRFFQPLEPRSNWGEIETVGAMLLLVPSGADPLISKPPVADMINRGQFALAR